MGAEEGRVALVSGASRGIGRAIALKLAEIASTIAVHYNRNQDAAIQVVEEIRKKGRWSEAFAADLSVPASARSLIQDVEKVMGRVDILVNNFGPFLFRAWEEATAEDWLEMLRTNVLASLEAMKAALPGMRLRKWGRIINLGFHRAGQMVAFPTILPYAAAKTALLLLTRTAASSEARHGITVNMVSPGLIEGGELPGEKAGAAAAGTAADVASAVAFLASEEAAAITGVNLIVAGTWKM